MAASRTMLLGCLAEPALLLVMLVLALTAGSLNLDVIVAAQMETAPTGGSALPLHSPRCCWWRRPTACTTRP